MKRLIVSYTEPEEVVDVYIGEANEIKSMYGSMNRNITSELMPYFQGYPKFNPDRVYGIMIHPNNFYHIITLDALVHDILRGICSVVKNFALT